MVVSVLCKPVGRLGAGLNYVHVERVAAILANGSDVQVDIELKFDFVFEYEIAHVFPSFVGKRNFELHEAQYFCSHLALGNATVLNIWHSEGDATVPQVADDGVHRGQLDAYLVGDLGSRHATCVLLISERKVIDLLFFLNADFVIFSLVFSLDRH